jgi:transposase
MHDPREVAVYLGLDVGKSGHHAVGLGPAGKKVHDRALPNSEPRLRALFDKLAAKHGQVLVVVDQPASIGALPVAVARDAGCLVAYLPGLSMRRAADLYPGEAKTDARDAYVIADAARTMPHLLRDLKAEDETVAALSMILGFDDDLAAESTRTINRIRGLLTSIHPGLERVLGSRLDHPAVLDLLARHGAPGEIQAAGIEQVTAELRERAPRMGRRLAEEVFAALAEQSVVVPGTDAARIILPGLAESLRSILAQRKRLEAEIEHLLEAHPLSRVLTSMPGIGVRTGARILAEVGDAERFATAAHLASYAGLAPVTRRSGTSIRGEHPSRRGNKQLKRAMFLAAFAALRDPTSRAYYDRKVNEGKRHNQALLCLARRRCDVLYAMLKNATFYEPHPTRTA